MRGFRRSGVSLSAGLRTSCEPSSAVPSSGDAPRRDGELPLPELGASRVGVDEGVYGSPAEPLTTVVAGSIRRWPGVMMASETGSTLAPMPTAETTTVLPATAWPYASTCIQPSYGAVGCRVCDPVVQASSSSRALAVHVGLRRRHPPVGAPSVAFQVCGVRTSIPLPHPSQMRNRSPLGAKSSSCGSPSAQSSTTLRQLAPPSVLVSVVSASQLAVLLGP